MALSSPDAAPEAADVDELLTRLGSAVRTRRRALGLTLVELARRSSLSHSFISQLERGQARPSMRSLTALASALDTSAQVLMALPAPAGQDDAVSVVRHDRDAVTVDHAGGPTRSLVRGERAMLPVEFRSGPTEFEEYYEHEGEELMYLVEGAVEVDLDGGALHVLEPGDSLYYAGKVRHRWRQLRGPIRLLLVQHNTHVCRPQA